MSDLKDKLAKPGAADEQQGSAQPQSTVASLLASIGPQLEAALGKRLDPARFARVVLTEVRKTPQLLTCDPKTLLGAVMTAAQLGLEPGPTQHSYIVPRRAKRKDAQNRDVWVWEAQFQLGYRGMIDLALRGGRTRSVDAHVVREGDEFEFEYGTNQRLRHVPALSGDEGSPVAVYAVAQLPSGGAPFVVLSLREVERRRGRGAANSPAWQNDWDAMARKTAVRALAPYLPQTPELAAAQRLDETTRTDLGAQLDELEPEYVDNELDNPAPPEPDRVTTAGPDRASSDDAKRIEAARAELDDHQRHRLDEWWKVRGYGSLNERAKKRLLAQDVEPILEEIAQYVAEKEEQERAEAAAKEAGS